MAKYIKKISIADNDLTIRDGEAPHTINGYAASAIEATTPTVTFANTAITNAEIDNLFAAKIENELSNNGGNK